MRGRAVGRPARRRRLPGVRRSLAALGALLCLAAFACRAVAEPPPPPAPAETVSEQRILALRPLLEGAVALQLRGRRDHLDFGIPLEDKATVRTASLKLAYSSSPALLSERSRLFVVLNGTALAELPLSPRRGQTRAEIMLPANALQPGHNTLSIDSRQEHRDGCSRALLGDLWTQIDPTNSYLTLIVERSPEALRLVDLGGPNWPIGLTGGSVSVLTTAPIEADLWLRIGGFVAQGLALRLGDRPVIVNHEVIGQSAGAPPDSPPPASPAAASPPPASPPETLSGGEPLPALPPGQHVLIGTSEQLNGAFGIGAGITGPYLGVQRLGGPESDPTLIVSGPKEDDVLLAAMAFADPAVRLPDTPSMIVQDLPITPLAAPRYVRPGQTQTLAQWAAPDSAHGGSAEQRTSFALMLPPDFYVTDNRKAELRVNYGYRPNLGSGSALHVIVNGEYAGLINLGSAAEGGIVNGQPVRLPLRLFRPGRNVLSFEPTLTNGDAIACSEVAADGPNVGVFGDSTLWLPDVSRVANQPDLGLFASLAYPYDAGVEGAASVVVTATDSATISAVWTLIGRLAQSAGAPLNDLNVTFGPRDDRAHVLLVGPLDSIDKRILARTPIGRIHLRASEAGELSPLVADLARPAEGDQPADRPGAAATEPIAPAPVASASSPASDRASWERRLGPVAPAPPDGVFGRLAATLDGWLDDAAAGAAMILPAGWASDVARQDPAFLGDPSKQFDGVVVALASPYAARRTATVVTAHDAPALERAVAALIEPATWYDLKGDVSAWTTDRPNAASGQIAARFSLNEPPAGTAQWLLYVNSYFAEHPAAWIVLVMAGLLLLAVLTSLGTHRPRRSHRR